MASPNYEFFASVPKGMEKLMAEELAGMMKRLPAGTDAKVGEPGRAGVSFHGPLEFGYRACLYSRIANRILLPLKTFAAPNPEKLYGGVKSIRWSDHLGPDQTMAVDFASNQSLITHTQYGALKTKDAVVDQLRSVHGTRPSIDTIRPDIRINVYVLKDFATVSLDLSGSSLHQRGYREEARIAPLKENLAAAILMSAGWPEVSAQGGGLVDPMCGAGTFIIEGALIATQTAPGLLRDYFGFTAWKNHDAVLWKRLREEAQDQVIRDRKKLPPMIGYDEDPMAIKVALSNLAKAGLQGVAHFEKRELGGAMPPPRVETGLFIVNPPYGERLGEEEALVPLYRSIGDTMKQRFKGWKGGVFTGSALLSKEVGLKATQRVPLFNGAIDCRLLKYDLY